MTGERFIPASGGFCSYGYMHSIPFFIAGSSLTGDYSCSHSTMYLCPPSRKPCKCCTKAMQLPRFVRWGSACFDTGYPPVSHNTTSSSFSCIPLQSRRTVKRKDAGRYMKALAQLRSLGYSSTPSFIRVRKIGFCGASISSNGEIDGSTFHSMLLVFSLLIWMRLQ